MVAWYVFNPLCARTAIKREEEKCPATKNVTHERKKSLRYICCCWRNLFWYLILFLFGPVILTASYKRNGITNARHPIKCCFNNAKQTRRYSYLNCQVDNSLMWKIYSPTIATTTRVRRMRISALRRIRYRAFLRFFCFYLPLIFLAVSGEIFIVCDDFHFNPFSVGRSRCVNLIYGASETEIQNPINNSLRNANSFFRQLIDTKLTFDWRNS